jgi:lipoate-protein ligase A
MYPKQKSDLRKFLAKLGIKSAQEIPMEESMAALMAAFEAGFGAPDKLYLDPKSFEQIQKVIKDKK